MARSQYAVFAEKSERAPSALYRVPRWYACYTRPRAEWKAEEGLRREEIPSFLPSVRLTRQWGDRKRTIDWPLIPSYVFASFALSELGRVLRVPAVMEVVRVNGYPTPVRDEEVESLRLLAHGLPAAAALPEVAPLPEKGKLVRVVSGPFEGVTGIVVEHRSRRRLLVGIQAIGCGLEVDIEADALQPCD